MGLSQQIGASSLIKPGVIDNAAARPASPFEGQVIFQKDTDQLLVWNGTAWITLTSSINPPALELITDITCSIGGTVSNGVVTVSPSTSSIVVGNAFSSKYQDYRIIYTGGNAGTSLYLNLTLGSAVTGYYGSLYGCGYATNTPIGIGINNGAGWLYAGLATTVYSILDCDIYMPNMVKNTNISSKWSFNLASTGYSTFTGEHASTTQHTGFTITPTGANVGNGTIRVYGYRNQL